MDWKLELAILPVSDVDRAKHFYSEQAGFVVDHDTKIDETTRIVQLTPPGSACSIAFGIGMAEAAPGSARLQLVVSDIEVAYEALIARGVDVGEIQHLEGGTQLDGRGGAWNSFISFDDPDGNGWTVQERPDTSR
jgi:catechol 2,3-dioxygenase-like lactoylglutathione lyase family enzyme